MSGNEQNQSSLNQLYQKINDKDQTFCMYPWIHLHVSPSGVAAPCCIAESCGTLDGVGDGRTSSLMQLVNSPKMNKLRLDMLNGVRNEECKKCYDHEDHDIKSIRQCTNEDFKHLFFNTVPHTNFIDGSLDQFQMYYFDIRYSNICNFKCRTCGQEFSSQWEQENWANNVEHARKFPKIVNKTLFTDVLEQIDHMEWAYFAGGEPLITEEHYIMLEEMIKRKRTDIRLRYSTNFSTLQFKDKDLLQLWYHFENPVDLYASIDHYGERAEYIRHGTDWGKIESNFLKISKLKNINLSINTVYSLFNALTFDNFLEYMHDKNLLPFNTMYFSVYPMQSPNYYSTDMLPLEKKEIAKNAIHNIHSKFNSYGYKSKVLNSVLPPLLNWLNNDCILDHPIKPDAGTIKEFFQQEVAFRDKVRGEDFAKTFPELAFLLDK